MRVIVWNRRAEDLWALGADEAVGKHLFNLDIGLPTEQLMPPIRACLAGEVELQSLTLEATNRRGRRFELELTFTRLGRLAQGPQGVILMVQATDAKGVRNE